MARFRFCWQNLGFFCFAVSFQSMIFGQNSAKIKGDAVAATNEFEIVSSAQKKSDNIKSPSAVSVDVVENSKNFVDLSPIDGFPKPFLSMGSKPTGYAIVVEKQLHRLSLLKFTPNHNYEIVKTYRSVTGKNPKNKTSSGDLSTPEGIYFVTGSLYGKSLPKKYGGLALTLDYPNIFDQQMRKSGSGIWLHSTDDPTRLSRPYDSEGCVVLKRSDLDELSKFIVPFEVPVVITQVLNTTKDVSPLSSQKLEVEKMIEGWRDSWEKSNFESYSSFYSSRFLTLGKSLKNWIAEKKQLGIKRKNSIQVQISDIKIIAYEDQLLAVFEQDYNSDEKKDTGRKFLYLKKEDDKYRIIAEKWYPRQRLSSMLRLPEEMTSSRL